MKRYRRLFVFIIILIGIIIGSIFGIKALFNSPQSDSKYEVVNDVCYTYIDELDIDLNSRAYLLIRLNDYKALYGEKYDLSIYPASLTKVLTMDTLLSRFSNLDDTSSISQEEYNELIYENASLAGLVPYKEYSLHDLLYFLVLPSGGDAAVAISNYFESKGLNLVDEMNKRCDELGLNDSYFANPTGLHDAVMHTTLRDLSIIYMDALKYDTAKAILKTTYDSEFNLYSTLFSLSKRDDDVKIFGGKTGYTEEAHQNIIVFYEVDNRSYMLLLAGADGEKGASGQYHIADVNTIIDYLYN